MSGPVAIVTGASSGIGKATALRLARDFGAVGLGALDDRYGASHGWRRSEVGLTDGGAELSEVRQDLESKG